MSALLPLIQLTVVAYGAVVIMMLVYTVILVMFRHNPITFFKAAAQPTLTAYATRSSSGTLPVTSAAADKLGVEKYIHSFSLPLGATINMDGTAIYVGVSVVFVADAMGVSLTPMDMLSVVLVGVLASVGTAGVPGSGLIMLTMAVGAVGLPMAPVALVAGIDAILDAVRTANNVTGDLAVTKVVDGIEKRKNKQTATASSSK